MYIYIYIIATEISYIESSPEWDLNPRPLKRTSCRRSNRLN